jgi:pseudoazurin
MEISAMKNLAIALLGALSLCFAVHASAANYVVKELNNGPGGTFMFDPSYLHVQPGDSVTFESSDQGHNSESVAIPEGAKAWKSDISQALTVTFTKQGVYLYQCAPHALFGMVGVIQVGKVPNKDAVLKAADELEHKQLMNQGRISGLMKQIK